MKTSYIFSIQTKVLLLIVSLMGSFLLFTTLIYYTEAKLQDYDNQNLLNDIMNETYTIERGVQTNNLSLIVQSLQDLRLHPYVETAEIYAYENGYFTNHENGFFSTRLNPPVLIGKNYLNNLGLKLISGKL